MSHNPEAPEPFQFPKPFPPLTDNVHKLLEKCRRRARELGVVQFTGNADGLFGNELAAAMIADGKAVAPEIDPSKRDHGLMEHYGMHVAQKVLGAECLQLIHDTLRLSGDKLLPYKVTSHPKVSAYCMAVAWQMTNADVITTKRLLSQYGIRAIIHPEVHGGDLVLEVVCEIVDLYRPGLLAKLRDVFLIP
ncbi:hypothetical protein [Xanthomonas phage RTH11]|nr:hypothetical protein [Xanthomonas phage RTH11]